MSNNIEHRSFWEYNGRPYHTIERIPMSYGRFAVNVKEVRPAVLEKERNERELFLCRFIEFLGVMFEIDMMHTRTAEVRKIFGKKIKW